MISPYASRGVVYAPRIKVFLPPAAGAAESVPAVDGVVEGAQANNTRASNAIKRVLAPFRACALCFIRFFVRKDVPSSFKWDLYILASPVIISIFPSGIVGYWMRQNKPVW